MMNLIRNEMPEIVHSSYKCVFFTETTKGRMQLLSSSVPIKIKPYGLLVGRNKTICIFHVLQSSLCAQNFAIMLNSVSLM